MKIFLSVVLAVFALATAAWADLPIYQIAVTGTPAPDGGTFTSFGTPTADREDNYGLGASEAFWFQATTSTGVSGVYVYDAHYNYFGTLADTTMTVPQGGATFTSFSNVSSGYGEVGFIATDSSNNTGVYAIGTFPLALVATTNTNPSPGVSLSQFQSISIMGGPVFADSGYGYGYENGEIETTAGSIYDFVGSYNPYSVPSNVPSPVFTLVANTSTTPPGASGPFTSFGPVSYKSYEDPNLEPGVRATIRAVRATAGGVEGIYYGIESYENGILPETSAPLVSLINAGAAVPDANGNPTSGVFTSFGDPIVTDYAIFFIATYGVGGDSDQQGIFIYGNYLDGSYVPGVTLRQIVATGQVAPDSGGATFSSFLEFSSYGTPFLATLSNGDKALYDFDLDKIIGTGDLLDGKIVDDINLSADTINAFEVNFSDGTEGLYYWEAPEPVLLSLLALPIVLVLRNRRHRSDQEQPSARIEPLEQRRLLSLPTPTAIGLDAHNTYGADNTEATDASTAINQAISAAAQSSDSVAWGGVVYLAPGTYYLADPIHLEGLVTLRGASAGNTFIVYDGSGTAIELDAGHNGFGGQSIQNLTIIATNGSGIGLDPSKDGVVGLDVENVKFETHETAINLAGDGVHEGSQDGYFHNIDISVGGADSIDPETNIYLDSGAEAINVGGNANDIDGLIIEGTPSGYNGPGANQGIIDIHRGYGLLLNNITIGPDFGSVPVTDFYFSDARDLRLQDFQFAPAETGGDSTRFEIINSDVTMDSLTLDNTDQMNVQYNSMLYNIHPIVVVDHLQIPIAGILSTYVHADNFSEVHISGINDDSPIPPAGVTLDDSTQGMPIPTFGVKVPTNLNDPDYSDDPVVPNSEADADQNCDSLQDIINQATGGSTPAERTVYLPQGVYYIDKPLDIPEDITLLGVGGSSVLINSSDFDPGSGDHNGLLELQALYQQFCDDVTIADLTLINTTENGHGITIADTGTPVDSLNVYGVSIGTGLGQYNPNTNFTTIIDSGGAGIYLHQGQTEVTNSTFTEISNVGYPISDSLFGSLMDIYGYGNTIERCTDTDSGSTYAGQPSIIVTSDPDAPRPTNILDCDTERGTYDSKDQIYYRDQMYQLSGPDINFFANYIGDNASLGGIELDGVSNFEGDSIGFDDGSPVGLAITSSSTNVHFRYIDLAQSNVFADSGDPSDSEATVSIDTLSNVTFDVVRYEDTSDSTYVSDSVLTMPEINIAAVNYDSSDDYHDVVVPNSSGNVTLTSSSTDPNQVGVSGGRDSIDAIDVISDNNYLYAVAPDANTTLTLDWSDATTLPDFAGSPYFVGQSGYYNKIVVDTPPADRDLTFVQGNPGDSGPTTIGLTNVQEIDTGSGSYDATLDFGNSGVPSDGIYYNGSGGSDDTLKIESSSSAHEAFTINDNSNTSGGAIGVSGVQLIDTVPENGVSYSLTLNDLASNFGDGLTLQENSGNSQYIDIDSTSPEGQDIYDVDTAHGLGAITFVFDPAGVNATIDALPIGPAYTIDGDNTEVNFNGSSASSAFTLGSFAANVNGDAFTFNSSFSILNGIVNLYDQTSSGNLMLNFANDSPLPANYIGYGTNSTLSVSSENTGANDYISGAGYIADNSVLYGVSGVGNVILNDQARGNNPFVLNLQYGLPSFGLTFNGNGNDSATVDNAPSSIYQYVVQNDASNTNDDEIDIGSSSYKLITSGIETATIDGGSGANNFTIYRPSDTYLPNYYNAISINGNIEDALNVYGPSGAGTTEYITGSGQIYFTKSGSGSSATYSHGVSYSRRMYIYLQDASGQTNQVNVDDNSDWIDVDRYSLSACSLFAFNNNYILSNIGTVVIENGANSQSPDNLTFTPYADSNTTKLAPGIGEIPELTDDALAVYLSDVASVWYMPSSGSTSLDDELTVPVTLTAPISGSTISLSTLTIASGRQVSIVQGAEDTLQVSTLGPTSGYGILNIGTVPMYIMPTGGTTESTDANVRNWLISGYGSNYNWNGFSGITTSDVAQGQSIGYYDNGSSVKIMKTWLGDTDLNGVVDSNDLSQMSFEQNLENQNNGSYVASWRDGDLNYSGSINADDWSLFSLGVGWQSWLKILPIVPAGVVPNDLVADLDIAVNGATTVATQHPDWNVANADLNGDGVVDSTELAEIPLVAPLSSRSTISVSGINYSFGLTNVTGFTYSWSATGPASVIFSDNNDNSANSATATFSESGIYSLTLTVSDGGLSATYPITANVNITHVDQSFNDGQGVNFTTVDGPAGLKAMATDDEGRIVAVGQVDIGGSGGASEWLIARYNADGTLDTTFGDGQGWEAVNIMSGAWGGTTIGATAVTFQMVDGQQDIIVGGDDPWHGAVIRLNPDGSMDTSLEPTAQGYDAVGVDITPLNQLYSIDVTDSGNILLSGAIGPNASVAMLNSDGTTDTGFGGSGTIVNGVFEGSGFVYLWYQSGVTDWNIQAMMEIDPSTGLETGNILAAGTNNGKFQLMRLTSTGALDTSFGNSGYAPWSSSWSDLATATTALQLTTDSSGDILIGGSYDGEFAVVRYTADGQIDTSFGNSGMELISVGTDASAQEMMIDSQGRIVLMGYANTGSSNDFAVVRLNANGSIDTTFGNNGIFTLDIDSGSNDQGQSLVFDNGEIVIGGTSDNQFCLVEITGS